MTDASPRDAGPRIRAAAEEEYSDVLGILEAAMLDVDADRIRESIEGKRNGVVLVAVEGCRPLGALALEGREVTAVAVRPGRRGQGIGSALVGYAAEHVDGALLAEFDAGVRPFYEELGFDVEAIGDGRFRGLLR